MSGYLTGTAEGRRIMASRGLTVTPKYVSYKDKKIESSTFFMDIAKRVTWARIETHKQAVNTDGEIIYTFTDEAFEIFDNYLKEIGFAE